MTNAEKFREIIKETFGLEPHRYVYANMVYACPPSKDGLCLRADSCWVCENEFWNAEYQTVKPEPYKEDE